MKIKIGQEIPDEFGLLFDGWTCNREHYIAIFASWFDKSGY
jgi:hypothetical protein